MARIKLNDGAIVDAVDLFVVGKNTKHVIFALSDGSKVLITFTIIGAYRAKNSYNEMGEPIYSFKHIINVTVHNISEELYGPVASSSNSKKRKEGPEVA